MSAPPLSNQRAIIHRRRLAQAIAELPGEGGESRDGVLALLRDALKEDAVWAPDNLFLLQEYLEHDPAQGIVRCAAPLPLLRIAERHLLEGDAVDQVVLRGPGAGEGPTASAVMGDVMDIARGLRVTTFGQPAKTLSEAQPAQSAAPAPYYLRMTLRDRPGALAKVATLLGASGISIDRMRQYDHADEAAPVLIVTHKTQRSALNEALDAISTTDVVLGDPVALRIEEV